LSIASENTRRQLVCANSQPGGQSQFPVSARISRRLTEGGVAVKDAHESVGSCHAAQVNRLAGHRLCACRRPHNGGRNRIARTQQKQDNDDRQDNGDDHSERIGHGKPVARAQVVHKPLLPLQQLLSGCDPCGEIGHAESGRFADLAQLLDRGFGQSAVGANTSVV
jgi:hypothetical protein